MGVNDRAHAGQLLASQRETESASMDRTCGFCGVALEDGEERVDHVLPTDDGERTERYCSPSCFVRQMEQVASID